MIIGRVVGSVVSTLKIHALVGEKLLIVQPLDLEGEPEGVDVICIYDVDAGVGDQVLVIYEGRAAHDIRQKVYFPVRAVVIGVVDDMHVEGMG